MPTESAPIANAAGLSEQAPESRIGRVQARIEHMILSGELPPGEHVNENALAAQLEVSRGPIREAFRRLEQVGLVTIVLNQGVFVRKVSLKEALDVYDIRASLARLAGETLARRVAHDQLQSLRDHVAKMDRISATGDVDAYFRENLEFHEALFRCTGNRRLWAVYVGLVKELHLFRWRSFFPVANLAVSNAEHHKIIEAVAAGDARTAGRAFEKHVQVGKKRMLEALAESDLF